MYCPKCGQQISDNMRFCSRCGLPISEVADWLSGGEALAVRDQPPEALLSPKRKGIRRGAKVMFLGGVLAPIFFALSIVVDSPIPLIIPFTILLAGFSLLLYFKLFGEEVPSYMGKQSKDVGAGTFSGNSALPPLTDTGIGSVGTRPSRTSEISHPPSVTDHTTKLLDRE